ncbi:MAG TPA: DUF433 domain-containing protein [Gemmatales bacterium]|nr:DUF433 domain-containing protein [Gemmatales bacterium]
MNVGVNPVMKHVIAKIPQGGWRIAETRISLDSVLQAYKEGSSIEEIVTAFPSLTRPMVYDVVSFYL